MSQLVGFYGFAPLWNVSSAKECAHNLLGKNTTIQQDNGITFATTDKTRIHNTARFIICTYNTNDYTSWHNIDTSHDIHDKLRAHDIYNADIIIWDKTQKTLTLAHSPASNESLYAGWVGSTLIFGNALQTITKHTEFSPDINHNALTSYMRFGYIPAPLSIYKNTIQIPPGCMMHIDMTLLHGGQDLMPFLSRFWCPQPTEQKASGNFSDQVETHLKDSCTKTLNQSNLFAIHLNDTPSAHLINKIVQNASKKSIRAYTITTKNHTDDDTQTNIITKPDDIPEYATQMARKTPQPLALMEAFHENIIAENIDNRTHLITMQNVATLFGDHRYYNDAQNALDMINTPQPSRILIHRIQAIPHLGEKFWQKLRFCLPNLNIPLRELPEIMDKKTRGDVYLHYISHWQKPKKIVLDGKEETLPFTHQDLQIDTENFDTEMAHWDMLRLSGAQNMDYPNRHSPCTDPILFKYMQDIPIGLKTKTIIPNLMKKYNVPQSHENQDHILTYNHIGTWLRSDLKNWAEDLLDPYELRAQNLLNTQEITTIWSHHQSGHANHAKKLWALLIFQTWYRHWISG